MESSPREDNPKEPQNVIDAISQSLTEHTALQLSSLPLSDAEESTPSLATVQNKSGPSDQAETHPPLEKLGEYSVPDVTPPESANIAPPERNDASTSDPASTEYISFPDIEVDSNVSKACTQAKEHSKSRYR